MQGAFNLEPGFLGLVFIEKIMYCALRWGRLSPSWDNFQSELSRSSVNRKSLIEEKCTDSIVRGVLCSHRREASDQTEGPE